MTVITMTKLTLSNSGVQKVTFDCVVEVFSYLAWLSAHKLNIMGTPLTCGYTVFIIMKFIISNFITYIIRKRDFLIFPCQRIVLVKNALHSIHHVPTTYYL